MLNENFYEKMNINLRPCSAERAESLDKPLVRLIISNQFPLLFI